MLVCNLSLIFAFNPQFTDVGYTLYLPVRAEVFKFLRNCGAILVEE